MSTTLAELREEVAERTANRRALIRSRNLSTFSLALLGPVYVLTLVTALIDGSPGPLTYAALTVLVIGIGVISYGLGDLRHRIAHETTFITGLSNLIAEIEADPPEDGGEVVL